MKRTPLYTKHVELGAKLVDFAGYQMPIQYTGIIQEHNTVRHCGFGPALASSIFRHVL
jgi:aminomethyltransferase